MCTVGDDKDFWSLFLTWTRIGPLLGKQGCTIYYNPEWIRDILLVFEQVYA